MVPIRFWEIIEVGCFVGLKSLEISTSRKIPELKAISTTWGQLFFRLIATIVGAYSASRLEFAALISSRIYLSLILKRREILLFYLLIR